MNQWPEVNGKRKTGTIRDHSEGREGVAEDRNPHAKYSPGCHRDFL